MNKICRWFLGLCIVSVVGFNAGCMQSNEETEDVLNTESNKVEVCVESLDFERLSRTQIRIFWEEKEDSVIDSYVIKRRAIIEAKNYGEWQTISILKSDGTIDNERYEYIDELADSNPQQYEYRVDVLLVETGAEPVIYEALEGTSILAGNIKICIDPGHYDVAGEVAEVDEYHYVEGNFVLEIAQELRGKLKENYGIDSCMTRDSGTITLDGYTDDELDSKHIALRGEYAAREDCDLFVSLHTNSNAENANGYETFVQPLAINKPIIILNSIGCESERSVEIANAIGVKLASANYELGLTHISEFREVTSDTIGEWTSGYNDGLNEIGTVVRRSGKKDADYYGILRGATNVGVPGMIIEHGFHSVPEVRKATILGDLKEVWANADAVGIAYGFGFTN